MPSPPAFDPPPPQDGELDLTNCHLHSLEGIDLPDDLTVRKGGGCAAPAGDNDKTFSHRRRKIDPHQPPHTHQALDLTANRLRDVEARILALPGEAQG